MALFTRNKKNTTTDVPADLADAYAAATPDPGAFMERAAAQLAKEHYAPDPDALRAREPGTDLLVTIYPEQRQRMYTDHFPELLARAEHLSRLSAAWREVRVPQMMAEKRRESDARNTCPVCGEVSSDLAPYVNRTLRRDLTGYGAPRMCTACRHTADLLYAQTIATPARQAAVMAALEIGAPSA